jgi:thioredoxin:protein disulfide reductase
MTRGRTILIFALALLVCFLLPAVALAADDCNGASGGGFKEYAEKGGIFAIGASFVFGIGASLTPCVWPMIPITVSIFGATESQSRARGAALSATFVLGIALLFTVMGVAAGLTGKGMGDALTKPWVVIPIALIFFALSASMFGAFEIALPSSLTNKMSTVGGVGFKGAFLLGLVMALVAAPCTGPFLTGLLIYLASKASLPLAIGSMFMFALGLGLPFFIAGTFAINLPKGGAWMMGIKWFSGVVLAYMGFKYLRDRWPEIFRGWMPGTNGFLAIAGVVALIGFALGFVHLLGERRKSPIAHLSTRMKLLSIVPAIAGLYMVLSWFDIPKGVPLAWEQDEAKGLASALNQKKGAIIDFGASWCTACKELEHDTWPDPSVREEAMNFVPIAVDASDPDDKVDALQKKYGVVGLPTVVLLDAKGQERARFNKFVEPDKMVSALKCVASK